MKQTTKTRIQSKRPRKLRTRVAAAFREMASGVADKAAYASTVRFYRAGGHAWTEQLA